MQRGLTRKEESLLDFKHLHERVDISGRNSGGGIETQTCKDGLRTELGEEQIGVWRNLGRTGRRSRCGSMLKTW